MSIDGAAVLRAIRSIQSGDCPICGRDSCDDPTHSTTGQQPLPPLKTLRDMLANPHAMDLPAAVLPRIAWAGRSTLVSAREKGGKSTVATSGVAAVVRGGGFLDGDAQRGSVLFVAIEEHVLDVVRRLHRHGAAAEGAEEVYILSGFVDDPLKELCTRVETLRPTLVVVDTLAAFAATRQLESGDATGWQALVQGLTDLAHNTDAAVVLLHHQKKNGAEYRDSTAIGAAVDVIVEMSRGGKGSLPTERLFSVRGRFGMWEGCANYEDYHYVLEGGPTTPEAERPLPDRIMRYLMACPGSTGNEVSTNVVGRKAEILRHLRAMAGNQQIALQGKRYYPPGDFDLDLDNPSDTLKLEWGNDDET